MRWLLVLVTGGISVALLIAFTLWVNARQRQLFLSGVKEMPEVRIIDGEPVTTFVRQDDSQPPIDATKPEGIEAYNSVVIHRGEYVNYEATSRTLRLKPVPAIQAAPAEVSIDLSSIMDTYCWPETTKDEQGNTIFLRSTYIPFAPGQSLRWPGEYLRPWDEVQKSLNLASYLMVRLSQPVTEHEKPQAVQVIVLGC